MRVRHTSRTVGGQIYIPEVNATLLLLCIAVVAGFQSSTAIGNAYGECASGELQSGGMPPAPVLVISASKLAHIPPSD